MLVNCPECSSPVFVRSAAIDQRKPQRCYSCSAQLLVGKDGAVEIAVEADPEALAKKKGEGLLSASPSGPSQLPSSHEAQPTKILDVVAPTPEATMPAALVPDDSDEDGPLDLSDEAIPLDDEPESTGTGKVNAIFGGSVVSGESTPPTPAGGGGVPAPAPISFGDLDLGPLQNEPAPDEPSLTTEQPELTTDPGGGAASDTGWPTMISKTPFSSSTTGGASGDTTTQPVPAPQPSGPPKTSGLAEPPQPEPTVQTTPYPDPETTLAAAEPPPRGPSSHASLYSQEPTDGDDLEEPTAIGDPRRPSGPNEPAPESSQPSWAAPSTQAAATDVHDVRNALTLEPSDEDISEEILEPEPYEPTSVDADAPPDPALAQDRRFSITGEDSSSGTGSGESAGGAPPMPPPASTDADVSSPFSAAMGGPELEGDFLTAGTLVKDVPRELIERARAGEIGAGESLEDINWRLTLDE